MKEEYNKEIKISEKTYDRLTEFADKHYLSFDNAIKVLLNQREEFNESVNYMKKQLLRIRKISDYTVRIGVEEEEQ